MSLSHLIPTLLACLSLTTAFPSVTNRATILPFDAAQQYVSNTGKHAFIAPADGDKRSPCPALNIMANHGYIPRNGYTTVPQVIDGMMTVFGLSADLASVLSTLILQAPNTNGAYDISGFPAYQTGYSAYQYQDLYLIGTIQGPQPMKQIGEGLKRTNATKYTTADPISEQLELISELYFRCLGNKSAKYPEGTLSTSLELPFLAMVPKGDGTFTWDQFQNRIPDNWYKNNKLNPFTTAILASDLVLIYEAYDSPDLVPNYNNIDMSLLTDGTYTNEELKDPTTNICFLTQAFGIVIPALAQSPTFDASTKQNIASGMNDFQKGVASLPCSSRVMKSMNLAMLGKILGLPL